MANSAYTYYKDLPAWAKGVTVVAVLGIAFLIYERTRKAIKKEGGVADDKNTVRQQTNELNQLESQGVRKSYPDSQYLSWANAITKSFEGCDVSPATLILPVDTTGVWRHNFSGSGAALGNILAKCKNEADVLALNTAYGIRTYDQCGIGTGDVTGNLTTAVRDELDASEINALNKYLKTKNISFQF